MIIVSQDEKRIVNFNQINSICIDCDRKYFIKAIAGDNEIVEILLGKYHTKKRALEIFNDLKKSIKENEIISLYTNLGNVSSANEQGYGYTPCYEMPKN